MRLARSWARKRRISPYEHATSQRRLRRLVIERAGRCCEYCLIHEDDTFFGCQVEHIIAGKTPRANSVEIESHALACVFL